jgi:flagellar basal body-associated protein FliL
MVKVVFCMVDNSKSPRSKRKRHILIVSVLLLLVCLSGALVYYFGCHLAKFLG